MSALLIRLAQPADADALARAQAAACACRGLIAQETLEALDAAETAGKWARTLAAPAPCIRARAVIRAVSFIVVRRRL